MKIDLELVRDTYSRDMGTFGKLSVFQKESHALKFKLFECETVERPWANNTPNISCIPEGTYELEHRRFYRGGYETVQLMNVPDRSLILIHRGNTMKDVEGCIAVGLDRSVIGQRWGVSKSRVTLDRLLGFLELELGSIKISQYRPFARPAKVAIVDSREQGDTGER